MRQYILRTCKIKSDSANYLISNYVFKHTNFTLIRKYRYVRKKPNNMAVYTLNSLSDERAENVFSFFIATILQEHFFDVW
jgi:hypothetical protein